MRMLKTILPLLALAGGMPLATGSAQQDVRDLTPGAPIERELSGDEVHLYHITLLSGQYLRLVVEWEGIGLVAKLSDPNGRQMVEVDNLVAEATGRSSFRWAARLYRPDSLSIVADVSGVYWLEVRPGEKDRVKKPYRVRVAELRMGGPQDQTLIAAERAFVEGRQVHRQGTTESSQNAIAEYQKALSLCRSLGDRQREADALYEIGVVYDSLSEYQKGLDYYQQALLIRRAVGDRWGEASTLNNIGVVYSSLGDYQRAFKYHKQALPLRQAAGDLGGEAATMTKMGWLYWVQGQPERALEYYERSLLLRQAIGDRRGEAEALGHLGLAYATLGNNQKALDSRNQSLLLRRAMEDRREEAHALQGIGWTYKSLGEPQKALEYFTQALAIRQSMRDRTMEVDTLYGIAHVEHELGNIYEAKTRIKQALDIIESLRSKIASKGLRTSYRASRQRYYDFYIFLLMQLHARHPSDGFDRLAFEADQRARSRSLLETLVEANADIRQGVDPLLLERERRLVEQIKAREQSRIQLYGKQTKEQVAAVEGEIEALLEDYRELQEKIRQSSPRYAALTDPAPLSLKEIQQRVLDEETLLLEYALGERGSFLWAVTPTSLTSFKLPKRAEIETTARRVYELLTASHRREPKRQAELAAAELSQMLLGPVAAQLGKKRLLIVSDGALQYVPFAALPVPSAQGRGARNVEVRMANVELKKDHLNSTLGIRNSKFDDLRPLIVEHEIISLPSASTLAVLRRELAGRPPTAKTVAVLADAVFDKNDERVRKSATRHRPSAIENPLASNLRPAALDLERSATESGVMRFERLRFSRREAEQIVALTREGKNLQALDFKANHATAISAELGQYRMVHFATHGLLNSQHPEFSGIVLSLVDEQGRPQDGFLHAHEIYNLKLEADLVVLSACRTALGKEVKGEGLIGLTRGFMYAGAPRVVASLWSVKDEATVELMKQFYKGMLKEGLRPAAALRAAQVSMGKEKRWEAPYYWAGFVIQGEWK